MVIGVGAVGATKSTAKCTDSSGDTATNAKTTASSTTEPGQSSHAQLGATLSSSSASGSQVQPPQSLSPVPTAASPSPYSTPYSGGNGANPAAAYQNISPTKGHLSLSQYSESVRAASFTQLFHTRSGLIASNATGPDNGISEIADDDLGVEDFYVIAVSTESDELVVWSVYEEKAVRTLKNIPRPRDVRMVDQLQAVVLCNRELMLYNLDQAQLVTKLKGVMNHKMAYYGLQSDKYVVSLSRNRMYVNVIKLSTGVSYKLACTFLFHMFTLFSVSGSRDNV